MHNFPVNWGVHLQAKSTVPMGMQVPEFWQGFGVHLSDFGRACGGDRPTGVVGTGGARPGCKPIPEVGVGVGVGVGLTTRRS